MVEFPLAVLVKCSPGWSEVAVVLKDLTGRRINTTPVWEKRFQSHGESRKSSLALGLSSCRIRGSAANCKLLIRFLLMQKLELPIQHHRRTERPTEVLTQGWSPDNNPLGVKSISPNISRCLQMCAKFEQMFFFCRRGCLEGLFWAWLTAVAESPVVKLA